MVLLVDLGTRRRLDEQLLSGIDRACRVRSGNNHGLLEIGTDMNRFELFCNLAWVFVSFGALGN